MRDKKRLGRTLRWRGTEDLERKEKGAAAASRLYGGLRDGRRGRGQMKANETHLRLIPLLSLGNYVVSRQSVVDEGFGLSRRRVRVERREFGGGGR